VLDLLESNSSGWCRRLPKEPDHAHDPAHCVEDRDIDAITKDCAVGSQDGPRKARNVVMMIENTGPQHVGARTIPTAPVPPFWTSVGSVATSCMSAIDAWRISSFRRGAAGIYQGFTNR